MKRLAVLVLAIALLLGIGACGAGDDALPTDPSPAASSAGEEQIKAEVFAPAIELYAYFSYQSMQYDLEDTREHNGKTYYRVVDPAFPGMDHLVNALADVFSIEIMQDFLNREAAPGCPLYIEQDNYTKLYSCMGDRGAETESYSVSIEEENETKVVYKMVSAYIGGEVKTSYYTRELVDENWVFTDFPMDW